MTSTDSLLAALGVDLTRLIGLLNANHRSNAAAAALTGKWEHLAATADQPPLDAWIIVKPDPKGGTIELASLHVYTSAADAWADAVRLTPEGTFSEARLVMRLVQEPRPL